MDETYDSSMDDGEECFDYQSNDASERESISSSELFHKRAEYVFFSSSDDESRSIYLNNSDKKGIYLSSSEIIMNQHFSDQSFDDKEKRLLHVKYFGDSSKTPDATKFISREEIAKSIMKPCCKNQCLRKLSPSYSTLNFEPCLEILHSARKQLVGTNLTEAELILKSIIKSKYYLELIIMSTLSSSCINELDGITNMDNRKQQCDTSSNSRLHISHYSLGLYGADHIICRIAFCNAFDITLYRLKRLIKEVHACIYFKI